MLNTVEIAQQALHAGKLALNEQVEKFPGVPVHELEKPPFEVLEQMIQDRVPKRLDGPALLDILAKRPTLMKVVQDEVWACITAEIWDLVLPDFTAHADLVCTPSPGSHP